MTGGNDHALVHLVAAGSGVRHRGGRSAVAARWREEDSPHGGAAQGNQGAQRALRRPGPGLPQMTEGSPWRAFFVFGLQAGSRITSARASSASASRLIGPSGRNQVVVQLRAPVRKRRRMKGSL